MLWTDHQKCLMCSIVLAIRLRWHWRSVSGLANQYRKASRLPGSSESSSTEVHALCNSSDTLKCWPPVVRPCRVNDQKDDKTAGASGS